MASVSRLKCCQLLANLHFPQITNSQKTRGIFTNKEILVARRPVTRATQLGLILPLVAAVSHGVAQQEVHCSCKRAYGLTIDDEAPNTSGVCGVGKHMYVCNRFRSTYCICTYIGIHIVCSTFVKNPSGINSHQKMKQNSGLQYIEVPLLCT
jgi:hypothetical protein